VDGDTNLGDGVSDLIIRTNDVQAEHHWPDDPNPGSLVSVPRLAEGIHLTVDSGLGTFETINLGDGTDGGFLVEQATVITGAGECIVNVRGGEFVGQTTALVDFGDHSPPGTGHNKLEIWPRGTASLIQAPQTMPHPVVVAEVIVHKDATLLVTDRSVIDYLTVMPAGSAIVEDTAGTITSRTSIGFFEVQVGGEASIEGNSWIGVFTVDGVVDFLDTSAPSTMGKFEVTGALASATGVVTLNDGAIVTVFGLSDFTTSRIAELNMLGTARLTLDPRTVGVDTARVFAVRTFNMSSPPSGLLDLTNNAMVVDYSGSTPHDNIKSLITSAYAGGAWTGNGITSSTARESMLGDGVGYAEATQVFSTFPATFLSYDDVDDSSILVRYTYYGDTNLDGEVNLTDFNKLAANFGLETDAVWSQGDSTYNGNVNLQDFNRLAANFGLPSLDPPPSGGGGNGPQQSQQYYTYEELWEMLMNWPRP
jgi:hypothetical protein